jgi:NAD(P)-dependent dehydrogenase (short-subunit alcohol dehydrogenase family)
MCVSGIVLHKRPITNCSAIANHPLLAGIARTADSSSKNAVQLFIRTHNETLSVVAIRVNNEEGSGCFTGC